MIEPLQKFLGLRGIHYVATRFGWKSLRRTSFDEKFRKGDWIFTGENPDLVQLVEKYSSHGHILALGCGTAAIAGALKLESFQSFLGVDLSSEAISRASKYANHKIRFETGDMMQYHCARKYNVILFPNSLNYASWHSRKKLLRGSSGSLDQGGRIIVSLAQPARYAGMIKMIRKSFAVEVDRDLESAGGRVLVFS
jgi:trans-aconitate methyltransferase